MAQFPRTIYFYQLNLETVEPSSPHGEKKIPRVYVLLPLPRKVKGQGHSHGHANIFVVKEKRWERLKIKVENEIIVGKGRIWGSGHCVYCLRAV